MTIDPKLLEQQEAINAATEKEKIAREALEEVKKEQLQTQEDSIKNLELIQQALEKERDLKVSILEVEKLRAIQNTKNKKEANELLEEFNEQISATNEQYRKESKIGNERLKLAKKEDEQIAKIKQNVLGVVKAEGSRLEFIKKTWEVSKNLNRAEALATLAARIQEIGFTVFGLAEQFNQVSAALNKTTNTAGRFDTVISSIAASNIRMGISSADAAKSVGSLYEGFNQFTSLSLTAQEDLAGFTSQMEKAGISSETTAKFLNTATRSMGMGIEQVKNYQKELFAFSRANGISMKTINDGLNTVMPRLAAFGRDGPKIFKDLAFQAKKLGMEMSTLLDITEQFTTFEGAATAAGELNSVLGGNLIDTMKLMEASLDNPEQAINMLRDSLQKTGKSFENLSNAEKRLFADILKRSPDETAAIFKMTSEEADQARMTQEQFNDAVAAFTPIGDKMKALFAAMGPVISRVATVMGYFVDLLAWFAQSTVGQVLFTIVGALGAVAAGLTSLVTVGGIVVGTFGLFMNVLTGLPAIFGTVSAGVSGLGGTIGRLTSGIGTGIKNILKSAAQGIVGFANSVASLANPAVLKGVLIAAGVAGVLFLIGLSAKYVTEGLSSLIKTLVDSGSAIFEAAAGLAVFSLSLALLGAGLAALGTFGLVGLPVLAAVTALIGVLGFSFKYIGDGISKAKEGISLFASMETYDNLMKMKNVLELIAEQMQSISSSAKIFSAAMASPFVMPIIAAAVSATPATAATTSNAFIASKQASTTAQAKQENTLNITLDAPIQVKGNTITRFMKDIVIKLDANNGDPQGNLEPTVSIRDRSA